LASVVELLELEGASIVTVADLARLSGPNTSDDAARQVAYELQRAGWLGRLRTKNAWEFLPGARGGPIGSEDRFVEFRARRATDPAWGGVLAMESAATLHGLAQRLPAQEVVALPHGETFPKAFTGDWRYVRLDLGRDGTTLVNELPTWTVEALIVGVAARPSGYRDVAGLGQWLELAAHRVGPDAVIALLKNQNAATRQRAAYLFSATLFHEKADEVLHAYPPHQPVWFGPRTTGGHFDGRCLVNDTLLWDYLSIGVGA
jgi:predicted transcriptional regulator of viral defense system